MGSFYMIWVCFVFVNGLVFKVVFGYVGKVFVFRTV